MEPEGRAHFVAPKQVTLQAEIMAIIYGLRIKKNMIYGQLLLFFQLLLFLKLRIIIIPTIQEVTLVVINTLIRNF
jgi:hypothetical protein